MNPYRSYSISQNKNRMDTVIIDWFFYSIDSFERDKFRIKYTELCAFIVDFITRIRIKTRLHTEFGGQKSVSSFLKVDNKFMAISVDNKWNGSITTLMAFNDTERCIYWTEYIWVVKRWISVYKMLRSINRQPSSVADFYEFRQNTSPM